MQEGIANVSTMRSNIISEDDIAKFFLILDTYSDMISKECKEATKPFICHYVFPVCDDDGSYHSVTKDECLHLQNNICVTEWLLAMSIVPHLVPNCELLNNPDMDENFQRSDENFEQLNINNTGVESNINCPQNFGLFCNDKCLPLCSQFSQYNEATTKIRKTFDIFAAILAITGGTLCIIITLIKRKKL